MLHIPEFLLNFTKNVNSYNSKLMKTFRFSTQPFFASYTFTTLTFQFSKMEIAHGTSFTFANIGLTYAVLFSDSSSENYELYFELLKDVHIL